MTLMGVTFCLGSPVMGTACTTLVHSVSSEMHLKILRLFYVSLRRWNCLFMRIITSNCSIASGFLKRDNANEKTLSLRKFCHSNLVIKLMGQQIIRVRSAWNLSITVSSEVGRAWCVLPLYRLLRIVASNLSIPHGKMRNFFRYIPEHLIPEMAKRFHLSQ